jgi:hypothetical protein
MIATALVATGALAASLWWGVWIDGRYWQEAVGQQWLLALTMGTLAWQAYVQPSTRRGRWA